MSRYVVDVYDCAGRFSQTSATDFAHCLQLAELMTKTYGGKKVVCVFNLEQADLNFDGLTEDERDAVADAIRGAGR